ncbi:MAG: hypothetical protein KatS3mg054_0840 [Chloroflexus sp.]|jgi:hypothetical protein|uniref:Uncharacterized protein n=1 Tax=Chloroflexus aurantiacus (strain ATCC 29366 / DSM 635 / J-10-fl) TaxID=324602 RepID=A9WII2_CHLAA|nr:MULTISPECIES: hypothetical protein [Chloroflexus]ABY34282.1 hypothetical protein Caur_1050 [Chloroflexus aurantiacus J-10-fl]GIV86811.1 MAG: hypothetical protein KatS3mg054_0840 [Chloroflexus sp.]GIV93431.1 MAG: hypothetical protein KatS3mg056_2140 [Chloroflexus sp.]HBW68518.1 hypothetical protein [Chloroflexus aurantiacus]
MVTSSLRQRLGRRLSPLPYYEVIVAEPDRLHLRSYPQANRSHALPSFISGGLLMFFAMVILIAGVLAALQELGFAVAGLSAALAGLLGGLGIQRLVGGYAIATTTNEISLDSDTFVIRQVSRVGRPREQRIARTAIRGLRLRPYRIVTGGLIRRLQPVLVLEMLVGDEVWILDSAAVPAALQPLVNALALALAMSVERVQEGRS